MKPFFLVLSLFFCAILPAFAQTPPVIKYNYLVSAATKETPLEQKHAEEASNILTGVLARTSGASGSQYAIFALSPVLSLLEEGKVEGVKSLVTAKLNVSVNVINLISSETLGGFDLVVTGSGKTRSEAITRSIQQLRNKKALVIKEIAAFDQKIDTYYASNCDKIQAEALNRVNNKEYTAALAMLNGIPVDAPCYSTVQSTKQEVFAQVQEQQCGNILQKADAFIAANNFTAALNLLSQVDVSASCAPEVKTKIAGLETKVDAAKTEEWEWLFKFWATGAEAEKAKWNALSAICLNWLRGNAKYDISGH